MSSDALEAPEHSRQRTVVTWLALLIALAGAFALTVIGLNSTVYSAGGFVTSYLQALQRGDIDEALSTPGVIEFAGAGDQLLTAEALGPLTEPSITSDIDLGSGIHLVSYTATLKDTPVQGAFQVIADEMRFGVFSTWSFLTSPMSSLQITPMHNASFTVNGIDLVSENGPSVASSYHVLTPGIFTLTHRSAYLTATPVDVVVTKPGSTVAATLDIRAAPHFVAAIQEKLDAFLDECTTQEVLFPTGCPFGQELSNRLESAPAWSMAEYPKVTIEPGNDPGTWVIPSASGAAHLTVEVRSLFDGTLSTFDEDVPFSVDWVMTITGDRIDVQS